jgi:hypothetical protein
MSGNKKVRLSASVSNDLARGVESATRAISAENCVCFPPDGTADCVFFHLCHTARMNASLEVLRLEPTVINPVLNLLTPIVLSTGDKQPNGGKTPSGSLAGPLLSIIRQVMANSKRSLSV